MVAWGRKNSPHRRATVTQSRKEALMSIQSEQALESQLMANLKKMGYEYAELKEEKNLKQNHSLAP